jgi:hypothetical protein
MSGSEDDISQAYYGPHVITCDSPDCGNTALMEPGAPGPSGWLDLSTWDDKTRTATLLGFFCSVRCLETAIPTLREHDESD